MKAAVNSPMTAIKNNHRNALQMWSRLIYDHYDTLDLQVNKQILLKTCILCFFLLHFILKVRSYCRSPFLSYFKAIIIIIPERFMAKCCFSCKSNITSNSFKRLHQILVKLIIYHKSLQTRAPHPQTRILNGG